MSLYADRGRSVCCGLALTIGVACSPREAAAPTPPRTILLVPPDSTAPPDPDPPPTPPAEFDEPNELAFSLPALNSAADARLRPGMVNVVAFGASWCEPCKLLYPALDALYRRQKAWLSVVMLQADDERQSAAESALRFGLTAPVAWDAGGKVAKAWKLETLPAVYVVDRRGNIRFRHDGYVPDVAATLEAEARELAAER